MCQPIPEVNSSNAVVSSYRLGIPHRLANDVGALAENLKGSCVLVTMISTPSIGSVGVDALIQSHLPEHRCSVRRPIATGIHIPSTGRVVIEWQVGIG